LAQKYRSVEFVCRLRMRVYDWRALQHGESSAPRLSYEFGKAHAIGLLGIAALAAIYGVVGFLFTRLIVLLLLPILTGAIGYGLLRKQRWAGWLLCVVTVVAGTLVTQWLFAERGTGGAEWESAGRWCVALAIYWAPFSPYYARRWPEFH
jgi:uncharacterized membrane protein YeaQ/YmgE (transglycosylase-associated protein family)